MIITDETPTSTLLELKAGAYIESGIIAGNISGIEIHETDEYLMFLFSLNQGNQITIKKLKQVC